MSKLEVRHFSHKSSFMLSNPLAPHGVRAWSVLYRIMFDSQSDIFGAMRHVTGIATLCNVAYLGDAIQISISAAHSLDGPST